MFKNKNCYCQKERETDKRQRKFDYYPDFGHCRRNDFWRLETQTIVDDMARVPCALDESAYVNLQESQFLPTTSASQLREQEISATTSFDAKREDEKNYFFRETIRRRKFVDALCSSCTFEMATMIGQSHSCASLQVAQYAVSLRNIGKYDSEQLIPYQDIKLQIEKTHLETQWLEETLEEHNQQLLGIRMNRMAVEVDTERETKMITDLHEKSRLNREKMAELLELLENSVNEVRFLNAESMVPCFDVYVNSQCQIYAINGFRLKYGPSAPDNLNWNEINMAWTCTSLLLASLRSKYGLDANIFINADDSTRIALKIAMHPLRSRALLIVEEVVRVGNECGESQSSVVPLRVGRDGDLGRHSLHLCGSVDKRNETLSLYRVAVITFSVCVVVTAMQLMRLSCLRGSMLQLYASVVGNEAWAPSALCPHFPISTALLRSQFLVDDNKLIEDLVATLEALQSVPRVVQGPRPVQGHRPGYDPSEQQVPTSFPP